MHIGRREGTGALETYFLSGDNAEVRVVPRRGGLVTHWNVGDEALLFLDETTLVDASRNVRGGIPLLFPNAGPLPAEGVVFSGRRIKQPQHGLARLAAWDVVDAVSDADTARVVMRMTSSDTTRGGFPFDFVSELAVSLCETRLLLEWHFTNTSDVPMPLHAGTHPYFSVPLAQKALAEVPSKATRLKERPTGQVRAATPVRFGDEEVDVVLLDHGPAATLLRGDGSRIEMNSTPQLSTLVVWTLPNQPFICVEPWTAPGGAMTTGEGVLSVAPGATHALALEFRFQAARH
jgi:galactose mutarotase-like enzyme